MDKNTYNIIFSLYDLNIRYNCFFLLYEPYIQSIFYYYYSARLDGSWLNFSLSPFHYQT